jgi:hypothetical protein
LIAGYPSLTAHPHPARQEGERNLAGIPTVVNWAQHVFERVDGLGIIASENVGLVEYAIDFRSNPALTVLRKLDSTLPTKTRV